MWDLPQRSTTKAKFRPLGLNLDFFGTVLYLYETFSRYFHKNGVKLTKSIKGFKTV